MAEYFEIDPTVVRVLWILSAFLGGLTILLYILLAFVMPPEPLPMPGMPGYAGMPAGTAGGAAATGEAGATADAGAAQGPAGGIPGWTPPTGWDANAAWQASAWTAHRHDSTPGRGNGRTGFALGVLLVVFGSIALLGTLIPAWTTIGLGPAFVLAPRCRPDRRGHAPAGRRVLTAKQR